MVRRLNADPNFKFGLSRNPLHPGVRTTWLNTKPHSLNDMSVWLEPDDMRPVHRSKVEENEFAQQGRNRSLTSDLAKFALRTAWRFRHAGESMEAFLRECRAQAFEINNGFGEPLGFREVQSVAKSVAKWAWAESTFEQFSRIQAYRAQARTRRNLDILAKVPNLRKPIEFGSCRQLLDRSGRTARRYRAQPRSEYETQSLSRAAPWQAMGISRRTYYRRKSAA